MTGLGRRPSGRDRVERLLGRVDPTGRLAMFHAACTAPAQPGELTGEKAALAAFRAAGHPARLGAPAPASPARRASRALMVKLVAAAGVVAGATAAVAVVGGVHPPVPWRNGWGTTTASEHATPSPGPSVSGAFDPGTAALCRAYLNLPADERDRALDVAPLDELVRRAGGRAEVLAFCAAVPSSPPLPPAATGEPTGAMPTVRPETPPTVKPSKTPKDSRTPRERPSSTPPVSTGRPTVRPTPPPPSDSTYATAPAPPERGGTRPSARTTEPDKHPDPPARDRV